MRIAIDISQIIYSTGVSIYTKNLVENLIKIDKENRYLLFGGSLRRKSELLNFSKFLGGRVEAKFNYLSPTLANLLGNVIHYPKIEKIIGKVDVYHSSDWAQFASDSFKVTTVHDLAPIFLSRFTDPKIVDVHKRRIKRVIEEVDRIIVPSEATKLDLLRLKANEDKIEVIYEAPEAIFTPQPKDRVEIVKAKYKIYGPYILSIGVNHRKNTQRIIEAYSRARTKDLKLVVVGHHYSKLETSRGVIFTGHVLPGDLPALYSGASALVYPSLYEGFGLPILEAFGCGCPVVTSNVSSMVEIAGDAAILVDPQSTDSITNGIRKALKNPIGLSKKGYKKVKEFSWEEAAKKTLEVYQESKTI